MPNSGRGASPRTDELLQQGITRPGADPQAVKIVRGQRTYDLPGFGFSRDAEVGADEDPPALALEFNRAGVLTTETARAFDLRRFSSAGLYLDFLDGDGDPVGLDNESVATITAWRVNDNGMIVRGPQWAATGHRVEITDETVVGRWTIYQITSVTLDGTAAALRLYCAGEGLGLAE